MRASIRNGGLFMHLSLAHPRKMSSGIPDFRGGIGVDSGNSPLLAGSVSRFRGKFVERSPFGKGAGWCGHRPPCHEARLRFFSSSMAV